MSTGGASSTSFTMIPAKTSAFVIPASSSGPTGFLEVASEKLFSLPGIWTTVNLQGSVRCLKLNSRELAI